MAEGEVTITVRPNGPFRVEGPIKLVNTDGTLIDLAGKPAVSLCRCGASVNKPFCDGTHSKIGFQAAAAVVPVSPHHSLQNDQGFSPCNNQNAGAKECA
jgi:CDGSH-type Zn-finger protein